MTGPLKNALGRRMRYKCRVNRDRHIQFLALGIQDVVGGITVDYAIVIERINPCAFTAILYRTFQFCRGALGVQQAELRNRHEAATAIATEFGNPAVVGSHISEA